MSLDDITKPPSVETSKLPDSPIGTRTPSDSPASDSPASDSPAPQAAPSSSSPARQNRTGLYVIVAVVVLFLAGLAWQHQRKQARLWSPIPMPEQIARVPEAWPVATLAKRLYETHKVRDINTFEQAAAQAGLTEVKAGGYQLPKVAGPRDLAQIFAQPPAFAKVTFPEGWTARQMALRLQANNFVHANDFMLLAYPPGQAVSPLEGSLFPDTYYIPPGDDAKQLARRFNDRFNQAIASLPHSLPVVNGMALTLQQVVTLASLVERETDNEDERPIIAGVLINRLTKHMPLQCDASVQYAMERAAAAGVPGYTGHKNRVLYRDLKIPSPYNTYLNRGLPPGPICNPGLPSLQAAAAPQASDYLFYVMSSKLGHHYFARNEAEHLHNIAIVKSEGRK